MQMAAHSDNRTAPIPSMAALPKAPLLGWNSFWPVGRSALTRIGDLPHRAYTSSGRAALYAALQQMALPAGSGVLVPTYHCPTMVAPIVEAGFRPVFYALDGDGLPALQRINPASGNLRAMFVAHYFGLAKSLHTVQAWCRQNAIVLVEDCAHSYFGVAGDRPIGTWGDYATASLSKFFPVPEAGLLASATRTLRPLGLQSPTLRAQARSVWDVIDRANDHRRLAGLTHALRPVFLLRRRGLGSGSVADDDSQPDADAIRIGCDMGRIRQAPSLAARLLHSALPEGRIVQRRRDNYEALARHLSAAPGARVLAPELPIGNVPYVLPLWVDGAARADAVYARLRSERLPVFRWDRLWPGTPQLDADTGAQWSRQVMQLLCHQDLSQGDLSQVAALTCHALAATRVVGR